MHKIPNRLQKLVNLAEPSEEFWDIGCDHGYLGLALLEKYPLSKVHFVDKSKKVCTTLQAKIDSLKQLSDDQRARIKIWNRDARQVPAELFSGNIFIAGLGGDLVIKLVEYVLKAKKDSSLRFILSPDTHFEKVKNFLLAAQIEYRETTLDPSKKWFALVTSQITRPS